VAARDGQMLSGAVFTARSYDADGVELRCARKDGPGGSEHPC
jgi:hypothetical protein